MNTDRLSWWAKWKVSWHDPITLFTFLLVIVGGLQAWTLYVTDHTLRLQQKPFVNISAPEPLAVFESNEGKATLASVYFNLKLTNSGNTPTKNMTIFARCIKSAEVIPEPWILLYRANEQYVRSSMVIGPRETKTTGCTFSVHDLRQMQDRKLFGYILADARYLDRVERNAQRRAQAAVSLSQVFVADPAAGPVNFVFATVGAHNCSDEDCTD